MSVKQDFKANVSFPLAVSYDTRRSDAVPYASGVDQRLVNVIGVPVQNPVSGAAKYKLVRRSGATQNFSVNAAAGFVPYLCSNSLASPFIAGLTATGTANNIVTDILGTQTLIAAPTNYRPCFTDVTSITGVDTTVIQCRSLAGLAQRVFYGTSTGVAWTEINVASAAFNALIHVGKMEFMDGYAFIMTSDRRVYNSAINTLNTWNTGTDFITKQIEQDTAQGLIRVGRQLLVLGSQSMEVMYNAGNPVGSPLTTIPSLAKKVGLAQNGTIRFMRHYYVVQNDTAYFLGTENPSKNAMGLYAYRSGEVSMVSTTAINDFLQDLGASGYLCVGSVNVLGAPCVTITYTLPDDATMNRWFMYNPRTKEWFEGNSTVFAPFGPYYHLGSAITSNERDVYTIGGLGIYQDDGVNYEYTVQFKLPPVGSAVRHQHAWAAVEGDTTRSAASLTVEASDDDYQTWSTVGSIDMTSPSKKITRLGGFYDRAIRLSYTGSLDIGLYAFLSRID